MPANEYIKKHIVDFSEEALLQVPENIIENLFVKPAFDALCTLVTTTPKDDWNDEKVSTAISLASALGKHRDMSKIYFV